MRLLIDACALYPTILRQVLLGVAATGEFTPLWSARILEEWARAAAKIGQEDMARGEIAAVQALWPEAEVAVSAETEARLWLPDPGDIHVLAAAIDGGAAALLTLNLKDFPTRILSAEGIVRRDPDGLLAEAFAARPEDVGSVIADVLKDAWAAGVAGTRRDVLKRARLPRLAKALDQRGGL
ncbi:MAG: PIN domain-containing protein [Pseudomonadota bacterium]